MMAVLVVTAHKVQICTEVSTIHILFLVEHHCE